MEDAHSHLPHIGLRNLKSAFSAALCAGIYYLIDRNPTFACIGAVYGMGNDMGHSWQQGGNRLIGTIIGGFLGMGLFWCYLLLAPAGESRALLIPLTFVGVVVLICLSQMFRWPTAVQPGSVVLCIILFNTPTDTYVSYALNRMVDTGVGVLMSMLINYLYPRERLVRWIAWWKKRQTPWSPALPHPTGPTEAPHAYNSGSFTASADQRQRTLHPPACFLPAMRGCFFTVSASGRRAAASWAGAAPSKTGGQRPEGLHSPPSPGLA